jgi:adenylate cyclase
MIFIRFFSQSLSRPLEDLKEAVDSIEKGHYQVDLQNKNRDETGVLTLSVNAMSHALANFEKLTNKELARLAMQGKLSLGGEEKEATIFFNDIRSFTAISGKMKPEEVVAFLNEYLEGMVKCVFTTGGAIDKFIGDAIFAHWGAIPPTDSAALEEIRSFASEKEWGAVSAVRNALLMRAALACFNKDRGVPGKPRIRIGCAINSGRVIAGQIGSDERLEFTILGRAVSLADRTETFNKPFGTEILITERTWLLLGGRFITEEMPSIRDNGELIRMFAVVNVKQGVENDWLFTALGRISGLDMEICRRFIGPDGPQTLAELRTLLGIPAPDLSKVDVSGEEKKYKLSSGKRLSEGKRFQTGETAE